MKFIKLYFVVLFCFGMLAAVYLPISETAASPSMGNVELSTTPAENFIQLDNMAPGDKITRRLVVSNNGSLDTSYMLSAGKESGNQLLYDSLELKLMKKEKNIYQGKLKDLQGLSLGTLTQFGEEELLFSIELPKQAGNEVKKTTTAIAFSIVGTGSRSESGTEPGNLPGTATNTFNWLVLGLVMTMTGLVSLRVKRRK